MAPAIYMKVMQVVDGVGAQLPRVQYMRKAAEN